MIQSMKNLNLVQKIQYVIDSQTAQDKYNQNNPIQFDAESIKSIFSDYSDSFILVTADIVVTANNDRNFAFKNCALFSTCKTEINDMFIDDVNHIYIAIHIYNLIEYSENYLDTQKMYGSLKVMNLQLIMLIQLLIVLNHLNIKQFFQEKEKMPLIIQIAL